MVTTRTSIESCWKGVNPLFTPPQPTTPLADAHTLIGQQFLSVPLDFSEWKWLERDERASCLEVLIKSKKVVV